MSIEPRLGLGLRILLPFGLKGDGNIDDHFEASSGEGRFATI